MELEELQTVKEIGKRLGEKYDRHLKDSNLTSSRVAAENYAYLRLGNRDSAVQWLSKVRKGYALDWLKNGDSGSVLRRNHEQKLGYLIHHILHLTPEDPIVVELAKYITKIADPSSENNRSNSGLENDLEETFEISQEAFDAMLDEADMLYGRGNIFDKLEKLMDQYDRGDSIGKASAVNRLREILTNGRKHRRVKK